jgi:putative sigma-54 modulation protein
MTQPFDSSRILMQGIHVELSPSLQQAILDKFTAVVRPETDILRVNVRLQRDQHHGHRRHFRAVVQVERAGADLVLEAQGDDAYATLDELSGRLLHQLARDHERKQAQRRAGPSLSSVPDLPAS